MSYSYAGADTFHATATLLEDGDVFNGVTAVEGMIEPLYDRTTYLENRRAAFSPKAWAAISTNGAGAVSLLDSEGVASVALTSSRITVTLSTAMASTNFAVLLASWPTVGNHRRTVTYQIMSTTEIWLRVFDDDAAAPVDPTATALAGVSFLVMGAQ